MSNHDVRDIGYAIAMVGVAGMLILFGVAAVIWAVEDSTCEERSE